MDVFIFGYREIGNWGVRGENASRTPQFPELLNSFETHPFEICRGG